jgi:hypothetical protein
VTRGGGYVGHSTEGVENDQICIEAGQVEYQERGRHCHQFSPI